ncbi:MAG: vWA domain-containing protein [Gammaproteobacteria bacterium]
MNALNTTPTPVLRVARGVALPVAVAVAAALGGCFGTTAPEPSRDPTTNTSPGSGAAADTGVETLVDLRPPARGVPQDALDRGAAVVSKQLARPMGHGGVAPVAELRAQVGAGGVGFAPMPPVRHALEPVDRERYAGIDANPVQRVAEQPVSTFSIDVDTGSYANVRRMLNDGRLPPSDAVRVEELINYFDYDDAAPRDPQRPFALHTEVGPNPWNAKTQLLRVALKAWPMPESERPDANLVFLVDVSGSMQAADKLPLLKRSLRLLTRDLGARDSVSLVVYAGASGVVLEPTPGDQRARIDAALEQLRAGGSTNGGSGIRLAYAKAREAFIDGGINRVIIATDGDFNVGTVNHDALLDLVSNGRKQGVALTTLGFGRGNYNDHLMEQLADHGDGNHAYIDSLHEARKVLVDQLDSTLVSVARDVKIQIEFNPARVAEYRLVGYENRMLKREDFNNDHVDAGDIGAGHAVTALYEIALVGEGGDRVDPLRYDHGGRHAGPHGDGAEVAGGADSSTRERTRSASGELAWLRLRYKPGGEADSRLVEQPVRAADRKRTLAATTADYRFAAAVAAFGQRLRGGAFLEGFDYQAIHELAADARARDRWGYRGGFLELVRTAAALSGERVAMR